MPEDSTSQFSYIQQHRPHLEEALGEFALQCAASDYVARALQKIQEVGIASGQAAVFLHHQRAAVKTQESPV